MANLFGFSTAPSDSGDFTPIIKYDARAGRIFRMDRVDTGNSFESTAIDITDAFKAIVDFENVEVGWIHFLAGSAPAFAVVPMGSELPNRPTPNHKNGIRFMVKLAKDCAGGSAAVREIAGTSKAFLSGIEALYEEYLAKKGANPGKLPVVVLEKVTPIKTGSGAKSSTNFQPTFRIVSWVPRGDFVFVAKGTQPAQAMPQPQTTQVPTPPSTGSTRAQAPSEEEATADDF
ncbi:hypothetical protein [Bradyrhizobium sp. UFLA05-112]